MSHARRLDLPWSSTMVVALATLFCSTARSRTTTYQYSTPPDDVFVTTFPGGAAGTSWPQQILDGGSIVEGLANVSFENELNNSIFFGGIAARVSNSSLLTGDFGWADPRDNGPTDPSFLRIDFSSRAGGVPLQVSFDYAISADIPSLMAIVSDTLGNSETITAPRDGTFNFGGGTGAEGNVMLSPTGSLQNIAIVRFDMPVDSFPQLQIGFDNLTFDSGSNADLSGDGSVDGIDLGLWEAAFGQSAGGDVDGDGDTDGADFLIWQEQYSPSGSGSLRAIAVPEPATILLAAIGGLIATRRVSRFVCRPPRWATP